MDHEAKRAAARELLKLIDEDDYGDAFTFVFSECISDAARPALKSLVDHGEDIVFSPTSIHDAVKRLGLDVEKGIFGQFYNFASLKAALEDLANEETRP